VKSRAGIGLLELLVAAVLATIVVAVAVMLLQAQGAVARNLTARSERNDAQRAAFAILQAELRASTTPDVGAVGRDSVTGRTFRGYGIVCGFRSPDVFLRYRGLRLPDSAKDSVLQLGVESVIAFTSVRVDSTACPHSTGEQVVAVRWAAPPRVGAGWLFFERGGYHLSTYALRYRQGTGSRQPVTTEVFDDGRSSFLAIRDTMLRRIDISLRDRYQTGAGVRGRVQLLNGR